MKAQELLQILVGVQTTFFACHWFMNLRKPITHQKHSA